MAALIPSGSDDLRIALLGNAGVGKSATANVILGRETFTETETKKCEIQRGRVYGRNIVVIDTPGINSSTLSSEQLKTEMRRCLSLADPGPHVFLLVIRVGNFTEDRRNTVEWIQENFGEEALRFTMVLFTGNEDMTNSQWLKFSQDVKKLECVGKCGSGYFGINSKREYNPAQITKLLKKIETRLQQNGGQCYFKEMYEAFQRKIQEEIEEEKRKKDEDRKRREEEEDRRLRLSIKDKEKENEKEKRHRKNTEPILWTSVRDDEIQPISSNPQDAVRRRHTIDMIPEQNHPKRTEDDPARTRLEIKEIRKPWREVVPMERLTIREDFRRRKEKQEEREEWEKKGATGGAMQVIPDPECHIRIVLLGTYRSGKSKTGNTILDQEAFGKNINSTAKCRRHSGRVENKIVTVIDTKGISHRADISSYQALFEESLSMSTPGPHVFLLVIHSPTLLNNTVYPLMNSLGPEFLKRALVLLTHGDIWGSDHRRVLNCNSELKRLVNRCGGQFQIFDNENREDRTQVTELLKKIEILVQKNGGQHYTNEMYLEAQRKRMEDRVGVLEVRVDELSRENEQLVTVIQESQRKSSEQDGCCLL